MRPLAAEIPYSRQCSGCGETPTPWKALLPTIFGSAYLTGDVVYPLVVWAADPCETLCGLLLVGLMAAGTIGLP
jgi:hypothetical protein